MCEQIGNNSYSFIKLDENRKERVFKLLSIYKDFYDLVYTVMQINEKIQKIKELKEN